MLTLQNSVSISSKEIIGLLSNLGYEKNSSCDDS